MHTKQFDQPVKRNSAKFPADFMFTPTSTEWDALRSHSVTLKSGRGHHRDIARTDDAARDAEASYRICERRRRQDLQEKPCKVAAP